MRRHLLRWPQEESSALQSGGWGSNRIHQLVMLDRSLGPLVLQDSLAWKMG